MGRLWIAVFAGYLALGATLQQLPVWIRTQLGGGTALSTTAVGIAFLATAACRPAAGRAGDRGHAKATVAIGGVLIALGAVGQWQAQAIWFLLGARLIMGAGEAALFSGAMSWMLNAYPDAGNARLAGRFGLSMWSGLVVGPLCGLVVARWAGENALWATVALLGMAPAVIVAVTNCNQPTRSGSKTSAASGSLIGAAVPGLAFGCGAFGYGAVSSLLRIHLTTRAVPGAGLGLPMFAATFLLMRWLGAPWADRRAAVGVAVVALSVQAVGLAALAVGPTTMSALTGAVLAGCGASLGFPSFVAITLPRVDNTRAGTAVAVMTSFWDLGIFAAGLSLGVLSDAVGFRAAWLTAALLSVLGVVVIATLAGGENGPAPQLPMTN